MVDYQLIRNDNNEPEAIFTGHHLALGHFLTLELGRDIEKINEINASIQQLENNLLQSYEWLGKDFRLIIEENEVSIKALVLDYHYDEDELPESTQLSDRDHSCDCGLLDFSEALNDWKAFCFE